GVGGKTLEDIRQFAREQGCSLWQASQQMLVNRVFAARAGNAVQGFIQLIEKLTSSANEIDIHGDTLDLGGIARLVIEDTGLLDFHQSEKGEKGQARGENLQELVNACRAFDAEEDDETLTPLQQFLDTAA